MFKKLLILPAAALAFACSKGDNQTAADSALNSDLSTAAASRPYTPLDSITAAERERIGAEIERDGKVEGVLLKTCHRVELYGLTIQELGIGAILTARFSGST